MPSSQFTDYYIKNTIIDPFDGVPIERTYGGLILSPNLTRRIRTVDVGILQLDLLLESDLLANLIIISYVDPLSTVPVDLLGVQGVSAVKTLGYQQGYQSVVFQRSGLVSLPQLAQPMTSQTHGGVWLKVGNLSSDVSPPGVYSNPKSFKMIVSWVGDILPQDSVQLYVYMRKTQNDPWVEVYSANLQGTVSLNSSVDLSVFNLGNSPQIAVRITQGVVSDVFCTVVVS